MRSNFTRFPARGSTRELQTGRETNFDFPRSKLEAVLNGSNGDFDVLVVGSGASGGWAAKRLTEAGLKVAILEAGRPQSDQNFREHEPAFDLKYHNLSGQAILKTRPIQGTLSDCSEYIYNWFVNDLDEPYTTPSGKPYHWIGRVRMTGGRTNVWGRVCLRYSDLDFKAASLDGYGEDWPLAYRDLAPYYDLVEEYVGITGMAEGLDQLPDGKFQPPMALTCQELLLRRRVKQKLGWTVTLARNANLTKSINGRPPCHYCGPCERGCVTHSYFNSAFTTVADALSTGRCTLISNAMVYQVLLDPSRNRARGLSYIDRNTREARQIYGRVVILCAQSYESVRILLNSASRQYPSGLANSSGVLGHYLTAHIRNAGATGELPAFGEKPGLNGPNRPAGIYVARFRNTHQSRSKDFLRGYGYQGGAGAQFNWRAPGFGEAFRKAMAVPHAGASLTGFGEMLPRWDNCVEIDRDVVDAWGIPVLRIQMSDGPNERAMAKDMATAAAEMLEAAGATNVRPYLHPSAPRWAMHEVGIARMGSNPKAAVLNPFQQTHDVKNLFVMDGSCFVSLGCQNPTLTIMALAVRSCDYLLGELKRGNI
jgi:choline dehydrogenase-like flavoprotein